MYLILEVFNLLYGLVKFNYGTCLNILYLIRPCYGLRNIKKNKFINYKKLYLISSIKKKKILILKYQRKDFIITHPDTKIFIKSYNLVKNNHH